MSMVVIAAAGADVELLVTNAGITVVVDAVNEDDIRHDVLLLLVALAPLPVQNTITSCYRLPLGPLMQIRMTRLPILPLRSQTGRAQSLLLLVVLLPSLVEFILPHSSLSKCSLILELLLLLVSVCIVRACLGC